MSVEPSKLINHPSKDSLSSQPARLAPKSELKATIELTVNKLNFSSTFLETEELQKFEEFCLTFIHGNKAVQEVLQKSLELNGTLTVDVVGYSSYAPAFWHSDQRTMILNAFGMKQFKDLNESGKYFALSNLLFELINSMHFPHSYSYKSCSEFETADDYAYYKEKEEFRTYCLHQEILEKLQTTGKWLGFVPPKLTFEEEWNLVNKPVKHNSLSVYAEETHSDIYRAGFRAARSQSKESIELVLETMNKNNSMLQKNYSGYQAGCHQCVEIGTTVWSHFSNKPTVEEYQKKPDVFERFYSQLHHDLVYQSSILVNHKQTLEFMKTLIDANLTLSKKFLENLVSFVIPKATRDVFRENMLKIQTSQEPILKTLKVEEEHLDKAIKFTEKEIGNAKNCLEQAKELSRARLQREASERQLLFQLEIVKAIEKSTQVQQFDLEAFSKAEQSIGNSNV